MTEKTSKPGEEFPPGVEVLVEIEKCLEGVQNPFKKVKYYLLKKIGKSNKSNLSKRKSQKQRNSRRNQIR